MSRALERMRELVHLEPAEPLAKGRHLIDRARLLGTTDPRGATKLLDRAIEVLAKAGPNSDAQLLLGSALLCRGRFREDAGDKTGAVADYLRARHALSSVPLPVLTFLALTLAAEQDTRAPIVPIYLEFLSARRDQPKTPETAPVYSLVESLCVLQETAEHRELQKKQRRLQQVLEADPKIEWAHYYLGVARFASRQYADALAAFQAAAALQSARPFLGFYSAFCKGKIHAAQNTPLAAVEAYREAARLAPERAEPEFEGGKALVGMARKGTAAIPERSTWLRDAAACLERAVSLDSRRAEYAFYLGWSYEMSGRMAEAAERFEQATKLDPTAAEYHVHLGECRFALKAWKQAQAAARAAITLDKGFIEARRLLGLACLEAGDHAAAVDELRHVAARFPDDANVQLALGVALYGMKRFDEAVRTLSPIEEASEKAAFLLARSYSHLDQFDKAAGHLTQLASRQPSNAEYCYYLGLAYAHLARLDEAVEVLGRAVQISGEARFLVARGDAWLKLEHFAEAATDYRKASETNSADSHILYRLGYICLRLADEDSAITYFRRCVVIAPDLAAARIAIAALLEQRGQFAEALTEYLAVLKRDPKNILARRRVGVARYRLGEYSKALAEFRKAAAIGDSSDELTYYLGLAGFQCSDLVSAVGAWEKLHERHPEDQRLILNLNRLHYLLGKQHLEAGKLDEAIAEWTKYLEPRPGDRPMKKDIAKLHFRVALSHCGRDGASALAGMRDALNQALTLDPEDPTYRYYIAFCDALGGRWGDFVPSVQELLPALGARMRLLACCHLGVALLAQNDLTNAEALLRQASEEGAKTGVAVDVNWPLAVVYAKTGRWTEAADMLREQPVTAQG